MKTEEYINLINPKKLKLYRKLFNRFDKNNNGYITFDEFKNVLKFFKIDMAEKDIQKELGKYDTNHNNTIEFYEFLQIINLCN